MKASYLLIAIFLILANGRGISRSSIRKRLIYEGHKKDIPGPKKNYTGLRLREDSALLVYYHDQTVAIVELGANRELFNCEILEVRTEVHKQAALKYLASFIAIQIGISFANMLELMNQCQKLEVTSNVDGNFLGPNHNPQELNAKEYTSLLSGVFPGTKWCGAGDLADTYYDLGPDKKLDKCCRTHDLCPVKVLGFRTQYNITNYSLYTKSHCDCDDIFYECLKNVDSCASNILGNIYFNVVQAMCVEDVQPNLVTGSSKRFVSRSRRY